ncbi:amino acid adenylation domain-containing protein [Paenibacillus terrae HPL-003]|uniref:Amino acid adenylation domain-containing protein n=1 Tax=Paenibacillus terrae (strain HPL-003) TaxID=985665 RepID=G7VZU6_PAETH|nr:non-ribosomal peptide synthetase [Paenibacillus terrae]AET57957.1 amino acid adenylation domain-containing protein [Paenibacillus terrae HPL-003]
MDKSNIQDMYELTPMQKGILYHSMKDSQQNSYYVQGYAQVEGNINPLILEKGFNFVIQKHDVLRTAFVQEKLKQPIQIVLKHREAKLEVQDITHLNEADQELFIENYKEEDRVKPYQLAKDVLIRLHLIKTSYNKYILLWNFHHIVMDGWCWSLVFEEILTVYGNLIHNQPVPHPSATKYSEYIQWLKNQDADAAERYWQTYLHGYEETVTIPRQQGNGVAYHTEEFSYSLSEATTERLTVLSQKQHTTLNHVIQTAWGILLQKYNRTDDVVFGAVVSGRPPEVPNIERIVGLFINTIPVRMTRKSGDTFRNLLAKMHDGMVQSKPFEYSSLADIQANSDCGGQLFDHICVFENYASSLDSLRELRDHLGFSIHGGGGVEQNSYNLSIVFLPGKQMEVCFVFNREVYTRSFIESLANHFQNIIDCVLRNPDIEVDQIKLIAPVEEQRLLALSHRNQADYPGDETLTSLFKQQVLKSPGAVALSYNQQTLTYRELDEMSNRLARYLIRKDIVSETIVAISVERSFEMVVGILAIIKAGATYMPIDPHYPVERIEYTLEDSGASFLLVDNPSCVPTNYTGQVITLRDNHWTQESGQALTELNTPSSRAYIIYTSGSTGKPKGVMVEHRNVVQLLFNSTHLFDFDHRDVWTMFHSMCFDFSVWEMYGALLRGGRLVIVSKETAQDTTQFRQLLLEEKVTVLNQTPSAFNMLSAQEEPHSSPLHIRKIIFGGEELSPVQLKKWNDKYPYTELINMYGITETTVHVTYKRITQQEIDSNRSNIGTTMATLNAYILDDQYHLMPIGIPGELYVTGGGVTRGYLNRVELTEERFIDNPFKPGEKMYKSGDLARWLPNEDMEYLGRIDHQVKIRGHRIELNEVSTQLLIYSGVKEGTVLAKQDKDGYSYLCAYLVPEEDYSLEDLRQHMANSLPEYMVPSFYVEMEQLPINSNGKIQRSGLPEPADMKKRDLHVVEPVNELEFKLVNIYQDVLGFQHISTTDHFLKLGGHSLKAAMLVSRIHKSLEIQVSIRDILLNPTVREMAKLINSRDQSEQAFWIQAYDQREVYPVTSQQKRLYSIQQLDPAGTSYNVPFAVEVSGNIDKEKWQVAVQKLVERHEPLRTSFHLENGQLIQRVHDQVSCPILYIETNEEELESHASAFIQSFELNRAPLVRTALLELSSTKHIFIMDIHHIICDGLSLNILIQDLLEVYQENALPLIQVHYKDYAIWQEEWLHSLAFKQQEHFWMERFSGELPTLNMPTDYRRPPQQTFDGEQLDFELDATTTAKLKELAVSEQVTSYMALFSAYTILLAKYSGQKDIIVGSPLSGRRTGQLDHTVGMFANVVPLRNKLEYEQTYADFLQQVKSEMLLIYENGDYPLEQLLEQIPLQRDLSRNPLFDTVFTLEDVEELDIQMKDIELKEYKIGTQSAKFDLTWEIRLGETIEIHLGYNKSLFSKATMERLIGHFQQIILQIVDNPGIFIKDILLLTDWEHHEVLHQFNLSENLPDHSESTVIQLWEERVTQTPDAIALEWREEKLTYRQVNEQANQIARVLRSRNISRDQVVGIMLLPSCLRVVSVMGVLKAGASYLPIDPSYPAERIAYFIEDSQAQLLITERALMDNITADLGGPGRILFIDDRQAIDQYDTSNIESITRPEDMAYVIYTSGSTGKPKGVVIEHHSLCNFSNLATTFNIKEGSRVLQFFSFSFDASVLETFLALLAGATLVIEDRNDLLEYGVGRWLREHMIHVTILPPSLLRTLPYEPIPSLHTLIAGGEACTMDIIEKWSEGRTFVNAYGPTEGTVCATAAILDQDSSRITIGRPVVNTEVYIVDEHHHMQPVGVPGELCISGPGLARGYLHRPELSREKFIPNPFGEHQRMYKTGDLARWLPNGEIEYLGRIDDQIKVRGYRVELGEITQRLLEHESILETCILSATSVNGIVSLVAYYVSEESIAAAVLRKFLSKELPDYMIPAHFVHLSAMPLTANGKIDTKALPQPNDSFESKVAPRNELEQLLVDLWSEVLSVPNTGIDDHFFELGGDSIKAIQLAARLGQVGYAVKIKDIMQFQTIRELASNLSREKLISINEEQIVVGEVPLTPIQQWVFNLSDNPFHWNQAVMMYNPKGWDTQVIVEAFEQITKQHDALRMRFKHTNKGLVQENLAEAGRHFDIELFNWTMSEKIEFQIEQEANRLQTSIDLLQGPLIKLGVFRANNGDHLLIIIHHLVVDAVSWRIIMEDFEYLYGGLKEHQNVQLPAKTTSFKTWSQELSAYANSVDFLQAKDYWKNVLRESVPKLPVELAEGVGPHVFKDMDFIDISLTQEETEALLTKAPPAYNTEINDLLLTALVKAIKDWTGNPDVAVDVESHGRDEFREHLNLTRTVGWFTSFYPVVYDGSGDSLDELIQRVQRTHAKVPNNGIGYGILKYLTEPQYTEDLEFTLSPEILFNYLGRFEDGLQHEEIVSSSMPMGELIHQDMQWPYNLEMNAFIVNGIFHYSLRFNQRLFTRRTMEALTLKYQQSLTDIINHCVHKGLQKV